MTVELPMGSLAGEGRGPRASRPQNDATRVRAIFVVTHEGSRVEATMVRRARG